MRRHFKNCLALLLIIQLLSCSSSDGNNGGVDEKPTPPSVHLYSDGFLRAYNPTQSNSNEAIIPQSIQAESVGLVYGAYFGENSNTISNFYPKIAYYEVEGKLWRLDLNSADIVPEQVSSASNLDTQCNMRNRFIASGGLFYEMP